jgi:hypothetical protein
MDKDRVIERLESIRNFTENMTYHAEQVAPRICEKEYNKKHPEYLELLEYLKAHID